MADCLRQSKRAHHALEKSASGNGQTESLTPKAACTPDLLATRLSKLIGNLFAAEARSATWLAERRQRLRRRYSARVLDAIHALALEQSRNVAPKSRLGKGLTYLREQWPKLIRYIENGSWPVSNNACENSIRNPRYMSVANQAKCERPMSYR